MSQTIFTDGIGYEGKVTLTLKSNNRVLESKTYKNNGTAQLFKFLGYCLIDSYEEAKRLLPNKILLLYNTSESIASVMPTAVEPRSTWQSITQTPSIISENNSVRVTYSFEVPRAAITGQFNQVALYGTGMADQDIYDFSAYYYLTDSFGELKPQNPEEWSATTILLIEWELTLSNKNVEANTSQGA